MKSFPDLLDSMLSQKADLLYLSAGASPVFRAEKSTNSDSNEAWSAAAIDEVLAEIAPADASDQFKALGESCFLYELPRVGIFNVRALRNITGTTILVKRVAVDIPSIDKLGLPPVLKDVAMIRRGLILVAGPAASGKSATVAAILDYRNAFGSGHIVTIEDDIRYFHRSKSCVVSQRHTEFTQDAALKRVSNWAADAINIGRADTVEKLSAAIQMAESGIAVIATIHGNTAHQTLDRMVASFSGILGEDILQRLALNLKAIVAQRLVPLKSGIGRVAAMEVVLNSPLASDLIAKGQVQDIKQLTSKSRELGMQTMDQALFDLYMAGKITYEDALRFADSTADVRLMIKSAGKRPDDDPPNGGAAAMMPVSPKSPRVGPSAVAKFDSDR